MNTNDRDVLEAVEDAGDLTLLRELIKIPSENPPGNELRKAQHLADYFDRHGVRVRLDEVLPGRPNVIVELALGDASDGPTLIFNGHLDTVPVGTGWTIDPFAAEVRDGRVYGRGAADMLAGVAAMAAATVALSRERRNLRGRLVVHAVVDEEVDARGSRHAASNVDADWVIVAEPSNGRLYTHGNGQLNVEVTFEGRAAHSSAPETGHNAIHDAAAFIAHVEREDERHRICTGPEVSRRTYSACVIAGGVGGSTVPDRCTVTIDRRVIPTETLDEALRDVARLLDEVRARRPGLHARLRPTLRFPPLAPAVDQRLINAIQASVAVLGRELSIAGFTGATDAAWYAQRGIPAVIFGPGDLRTAHQPDESVAIDDLALSTRALALTARRLLTSSPA
jgi:acetylornithine deacetylase/succinyl-diaminopimelate desuccinylase family protein